jgi:hypothetical protein
MTPTTIKLAGEAEKKKAGQSTQQSHSDSSSDPFLTFTPPPIKKKTARGLPVDEVEAHQTLREIKTEPMTQKMISEDRSECTFAPKMVSSAKVRQKASERRDAIAQVKTERMDELRRRKDEREEADVVAGDFHYHHDVPKNAQDIMDLMKYLRADGPPKKKRRPIWRRQ